MSSNKTKTIHFVYDLILSVVIILTGLCFIAACLHIYFAGAHVYTRQIVAEHFSVIAVPVYLCLVLVIGAFLLELALPREKKRPSPTNQQAVALKNLQKRRVLEQGEQEVIAAICTEQRIRRRNTSIGVCLLVLGSIIFLSYGCNPANFHSSQITPSMIRAMWVMLPCLAVPFAWAVYAAHHARGSIGRELELWKKLPAGEVPPAAPKADRTALVRGMLVAAALILIVVGFAAGGTADVLTKAINICTECVGLG